MKTLNHLLLAGATFLAALPAGAFELAHGKGTLELAKPPAKIVTFDLAALDSLNALGVPVVGVPKSGYEGSLAKFQDTTIVGTLFEPNYTVLEKIHPDLIIAGGRSRKAIPQLNEIAPTVSFDSDRASFMDSFAETNLALGRAFGKEAQAKKKLQAVQANVDTLHRLNKGKTGAVLFVINDNVMPHVPGDRFGYALEVAGLESVLPASDPNAAAAPRPEPGSEAAKAAAAKRAQDIAAIAQANPDWLLVLDRGAINGGKKTAADTLAKHPQLSQTDAYKEGRVYYLDPNGWYIVGGGLNNLTAITERMVEKMQ